MQSSSALCLVEDKNINSALYSCCWAGEKNFLFTSSYCYSLNCTNSGPVFKRQRHSNLRNRRYLSLEDTGSQKSLLFRSCIWSGRESPGISCWGAISTAARSTCGTGGNSWGNESSSLFIRTWIGLNGKQGSPSQEESPWWIQGRWKA